jgi:hypothetical protein
VLPPPPTTVASRRRDADRSSAAGRPSHAEPTVGAGDGISQAEQSIVGRAGAQQHNRPAATAAAPQPPAVRRRSAIAPRRSRSSRRRQRRHRRRRRPRHPVPPAPPRRCQSVVADPVFVKKLDELAQELEAPTKKTVVSVGSVAGMSTTLLSVGYVIWCLRGGSLVATLLTTLPLWKWLDPLPVLDHTTKKASAVRDKPMRMKSDFGR